MDGSGSELFYDVPTSINSDALSWGMRQYSEATMDYTRVRDVKAWIESVGAFVKLWEGDWIPTFDIVVAYSEHPWFERFNGTSHFTKGGRRHRCCSALRKGAWRVQVAGG